jgi:UDP-2,3-diacylglucosamine pyrophosphatase LpxH
VKAEVKNVVSFISRFEEAVVRYARDFDVDGVLCGHIHTAAIRQIHGVAYYNAGDWVESCTAIVERYDGTMELLHLAEETSLENSILEVSITKDLPPTHRSDFVES